MDHPLRVFRERHEPPLSQGDLAGLLGVSRETVTRWESGARKIDVVRLPEVSIKTGLSPKDLRPDLAGVLSEAAE